MYSIGVDIGGSHISSCAYSHKDQSLVKETLAHKKVNPNGSKEEILEAWVHTLKSTIHSLAKPINGIGLAMPGPFDYFNGISKITDVEKLQSLYDVNLRSELAKNLNIEASQIRFINDATAFSVAEALIGKAAIYDRAVAITLGTGFGSSFLENAKPIIEGENVPDGGFLYNKAYENAFADDLFSTRGLIQAYYLETGTRLNNVKELCALVDEEPKASIVFQNFGLRLGDFIKPYLQNFDAQVLVLGGNISKAFKHFGTSLKEQLTMLDELYVSDFGEEAAMMGSALLLDDTYYTGIADTLRVMR